MFMDKDDVAFHLTMEGTHCPLLKRSSTFGWNVPNVEKIYIVAYNCHTQRKKCSLKVYKRGTIVCFTFYFAPVCDVYLDMHYVTCILGGTSCSQNH